MTPLPRTARTFGRELDGRPALGFIGPNWFATVMGTGIVANAAATLPVGVPGLLAAARLVWVLDVVLLAVVATATALHWRHHPAVARGHLDDPAMAPFYGAPAMALLTVGAGALLLGPPLLGDAGAVVVSGLLWTAGTAVGLWTAVAVPLRLVTNPAVGADSASAAWLMPVVPPMVSAATGALLVPHLPAGQWRLSLQLACTAMFGLTLLASLLVLPLVWGRLVHHGVGAAAAVPTHWIVLGPLGQSVTAAHTLGGSAGSALTGPYEVAFQVAGVVYGVPVWGFAMLWGALALTLTVRTARQGLPFSLTWWSFTFPVGTVVTGTSGLAAATGAHLFAVAAVVLYLVLVGAWAVVATRTARGVYRGGLLRSPARG